MDNTILASYDEFAEGDMYDREENFSHGNISVIDDLGINSEIFGFGSPAERDRTQMIIFSGKYNTWRLSPNYLPLIELADFEGMPVEDALAKLAESVYYCKEFDEYGNFFMVSRELENAISFQFDDKLDEKYDVLSKIVDYDSIANRLTIIPYKTVLQPAKIEVTLRARYTNQEMDMSVNLQQNDTETKNIVLL